LTLAQVDAAPAVQVAADGWATDAAELARGRHALTAVLHASVAVATREAEAGSAVDPTQSLGEQQMAALAAERAQLQQVRL
jgi:hypothetical protein